MMILQFSDFKNDVLYCVCFYPLPTFFGGVRGDGGDT